jgi:ribose transport system substrate-binding protein
MKKLFILTLILLVLIGALSVNCLADQKKHVIAFVPKALISPAYVNMMEGVKAEAAKRGWEFICLSPPNETASDVQISLIEDLIEQKVDAITIGPCDDNAIGEAIRKCNEANIPVVLINSDMLYPDLEVLANSTADEVAGGEIVGQFCVDSLKDRATKNVVLIEGILGHICNNLRQEGFFNIVNKHPEIKILAKQPANWERAQGMAVMENFLTAYNQIDFVFGLSDEPALGATEALRAAGKLGDIVVMGYDGNADALESIKKGELDATVYVDWFEVARVGAEMAIDFVENGTKPEKQINKVPGSLCTQENVEDFLIKHGAKK